MYYSVFKIRFTIKCDLSFDVMHKLMQYPIFAMKLLFIRFFAKKKSSKKVGKICCNFFEASNIKEEEESGMGQCQLILRAHFHTLKKSLKKLDRFVKRPKKCYFPKRSSLV